MVEQSPADSRLRFMLAMELSGTGDAREAIRQFDELVRNDADYVAGYFQAGRAAESLDEPDAARAWYRRGLEAAQRTGDRHAAGELEDALEMLG
jgi:Tfp pilus assembly protein PilF